ncbi:MAG: acetylxylan esterase [Chloroflexaceae bacterium]|jgi:cephalosporin-C deacetylase|nr:acetylxylan esterase [Chloroflexaceae bacterium]
MAFFDFSLDELRAYRPERHEPADFDAFWAETLAAARQHPTGLTLEPVDDGLSLIETFDVTFNGYGGQPIKAWLNLPRARSGPLPLVVSFHGYTCGRGFGFQYTHWPAAGFAQLVLDNRGQGATCLRGDTPDIADGGIFPAAHGFMTRGILAPQGYYYRRLFTDAIRLVDAAVTCELFDPTRIAVEGGSQGGGIGLAVCGLSPHPAAAMVDVPFLCHYRRAIRITDAHPYQEIVEYCRNNRDRVEQALATLDYFDGVQFAARARCQALFSVGLLDEVCPPSTVFAAYNHYAGDKQINVWEYNHHEGGGIYQERAKLRFLTRLWR